MPGYNHGKEHLGRGLAFPLQVDARGGLALAGGETDIEEAIRIILGTAPGERRMRPEFGCRIHELVFAPRDAVTEALAGRYVEEALRRWEPRITVVAVNAVPAAENDGMLLLEIQYEVNDYHDPRTIVYPLYLTAEGE